MVHQGSMWRFVGALLALYSVTFASPLADATQRVGANHERVRTSKKRTMATEAAPILATLVNVHTREHMALTQTSPTPEEFRALLHDRATGAEVTFDPKLLGLLRTLATRYPMARFEIVSGFRSPKLNEMMRKKGHHVASHSQHSLGHAVDYRLLPTDQARGIDPRDLEKEVRSLGWEGGTGVYTLKSDWFIHCDVGRNRRWKG